MDRKAIDAGKTFSSTLRLARQYARWPRKLAPRSTAPVPSQALFVAVVIVGLTTAIALLISATRTATPAEHGRDEIAGRTDDLGPTLPLPDVIAEPEAERYTVQEGDTLLDIAYRLGSSPDAIRVASNLSDPDFLSVGQRLLIPPVQSTVQAIDPVMTVREIAGSFRASPEVLATYNGISANLVDQPIARDIVVVPPGVGGSAQRALPTAPRSEPMAVARAGTADAAEPTVAAPVSVYTIVEGDTISSIAEKLGVDADAIVAANRVGNADWIWPGEALAVPIWTRPALPVGEPTSPEITVFAASAAAEPQASMAAAPARAPVPFTYEIVPGDTLSDVAWRFGVDVYTLVNNNDLGDPDRVREGQQLTILPVSGLLYTVQPGDTLADVAYTYKIDLGPIIDFNYLANADVISVGQELILPGASPLPPPAPAVAARPQAPTVYQVAPGDTVLSIARRFGVEPDDIITANRLRSADRIAVGDELKIVPGAAGSRPAAAPVATVSHQQQTVTRNLPVPAPPPATAARPSTPGGGAAIVSVALRYNGSRYVWGGTTPAGFDSSGFMYYVMGQAGKPVPRGYWGQINAGPRVGRDELQPGDLVFFQNTYMAGLSHGGIYIGNGKMIHASTPETGVNIADINTPYWTSRWFGATRVW